MTHKLRWFSMTVVLGVLIYWGLAMGPAQQASKDDSTTRASVPVNRRDNGTQILMQGNSDTQSTPAAPAAAPERSDELLDMQHLGTDSVDNLLARPTSAEAAWMRRHGYPIYDEWIRRNEILLEELERRAARNDVAAQIMLAERLSDTHPNRAEQLLDQALSAGSAFAAGVLADQLSTRALAETDPRLVSLYRDQIFRLGQIAALLGDYRVSEQIVLRNVQIPVDGYTLSRAMYGAHLFLSETNAQRQRTGLPPLQPSIRPGFDAWNLLLHGPRPETISIDCSARPDLCVPVSRKQ